MIGDVKKIDKNVEALASLIQNERDNKICQADLKVNTIYNYY